MDLQKMFEEARQNEITKVEKNNDSSQRANKDDRLVQQSPGNTYRFRLLYYIPNGSKRRKPFINKYVHNFWDDGAENGQKSNWVTCPTSEYLDDKAGFKKCPICEANSAFYKDAEKNKSVTSKELYNLFKRKFYGFALVYVVNDPKTPDNNGKIKILKYGKDGNEFLKHKIFGITIGPKKETIILPKDDENVIGSDAFNLKNGLDLLVTVTSKEVTDEASGKKRTYPNYGYEFARKASDVPITDKEIADAEKELKFDTDFYSASTKEEILSFYKKFVVKETVIETAPASSPDKEEKMDELPMNEEKEEVKTEEKPSVSAPTTVGDDEIDIDAILKSAKDNLG